MSSFPLTFTPSFFKMVSQHHQPDIYIKWIVIPFHSIPLNPIKPLQWVMVSIPPIENTSPESVFGFELRNLWKTAIAQLNKSSAYTQHAGSPVRQRKFHPKTGHFATGKLFINGW